LFDSIYEYAEQNDIKTLMHLGDFWHNRKSIDIKSLLVGLGVADNVNTVFDDTYIITGNHDTIYKDDIKISLLSVFNKHENIHIINEPTSLGNILMLPWLFDSDMLKNDEAVHDILLGHFDISGCNMNSSGFSKKDARYKQSDFSDFKLVLSGHYHTPGVYGNIQYLGSPFHMTFNDVGSTRGFYVLDTNTLELEFIENQRFCKYVRIKDTDDPADVAGLVPDSIVEFVFTKDWGIEKNLEIIERVKSWSPHTLIPKYVNIEESMSQEDIAEEDIELKDHLEILLEYYDYSEQPEHIDVKMLKQMAKKIYEETVNGKS
jgi:DNA repair exonuclease SbcCD nuclease subunit